MKPGTYVSVKTPQGDASPHDYMRGTIVELSQTHALVQFSAPKNDKPQLIELDRLITIKVA